MRDKCLPLYLSADLYRRLEQQALAWERDPIQQARWLLKEALRQETPTDRPTETAAPVGAGT